MKIAGGVATGWSVIMSFELKSGERLRRSVRRIARQQIDSAVEEITQLTQRGGDKHVHEIRKACKKLRALLRLVRPVLADATYRAENACFRDAARPLTQVRDAKVMLQTLYGLVAHFEDQLAGDSFDAAHLALQAHLTQTRDLALSDLEACTEITEALRAACERVKDWADVPNRWHTIGDGLGATYKLARRALQAATENPTAETLHEWRKQIKYLLYQLQIVKPTRRARLDELINEADRLASQLGEDHDLAVLRAMLLADPGTFGGDGEVERLLALIDQRRGELQQLAFADGQRFLNERTKDFSRAMRSYWKRWHNRSHVSHAR